MQTPPISPVLTQNQNNTTEVNQPPVQNTVVNNTQSTITSAESPTTTAEQSQECGCCEAVYKCFNSFIKAIRNCLSMLPFIGSWFTEASNKPTDASRLEIIKGLCAENAATEDAVKNALEAFNQMEDANSKLNALNVLYESEHISKEVFLSFYNALPEESKNVIKKAIFDANNNSSVLEGHDHLMGLGDHLMNDRYKHNIMTTAMTNIKNQLKVTT